MTTIRLGTGADAVEVEDGADIPLRNGSRFTLRYLGDGLWGGRFSYGTRERGAFALIKADDGRLIGPWPDEYYADLAALRRERAPKHNGAWVLAAEREAGRPMLHAAIKGSPIADYWTWRPFNTPEKQAAFDAALEAWLADGSAFCGTSAELYNAARALGYGGKR